MYRTPTLCRSCFHRMDYIFPQSENNPKQKIGTLVHTYKNTYEVMKLRGYDYIMW